MFCTRESRKFCLYHNDRGILKLGCFIDLFTYYLRSHTHAYFRALLTCLTPMHCSRAHAHALLTTYRVDPRHSNDADVAFAGTRAHTKISLQHVLFSNPSPVSQLSLLSYPAQVVHDIGCAGTKKTTAKTNRQTSKNKNKILS